MKNPIESSDYREVTVGDDQFALYYNQDNMVTTITTVNKVIHHQTQPVIATKQDLYTRTPNTPPPYSFGVQHYEMETDEITPSSDGDQAIREIFHYLEDDRYLTLYLAGLKIYVFCQPF